MSRRTAFTVLLTVLEAALLGVFGGQTGALFDITSWFCPANRLGNALPNVVVQA